MKALHILLGMLCMLVFGAASAQVTIRVSVTYSKEARDQAGSDGAIKTIIDDAFRNANGAHSTSGTGITLQQVIATAAAKSAPIDNANTADLKQQYAWTEHSVEAWLQRCGGARQGCSEGASISIHVTANNTTTTARYAEELPGSVSPGPNCCGWTAVGVVPLNNIDENSGAWLEWVVNHIIGSSPYGYSTRGRTYGIDPYVGGNTYPRTEGTPQCYHTRDTPPNWILPTNTPVPNLSYWTMPGLGNGSNVLNDTCAAYMVWYNGPSGLASQHGNANSYLVTDATSTTALCKMRNTVPDVIFTENMSWHVGTGSAPVSCSETQTASYSKAPPATRPTNPPGWPLGQLCSPPCTSVELMQARAATVRDFADWNAVGLSKALDAEAYGDLFLRMIGRARRGH